MTRWKASFIHLLISIAIIGTVAAYIIYFWYPLALIPMAKADKLLGLVGGIDLIVGPLMTLIIYKTGKASLKMDLTVIALIQIAFLSIGLYTMFMSRPVFIVASPKRFDLVFANEITPEQLAKAITPSHQTLSITKPQLVGVKVPTNAKERTSVLFSALSGGADLQMMPQYYVDYPEMISDVLANSLPLKTSKEVSKQALAIMVDAAKAYGYTPNGVNFMQLGSSRGFGVMLVDAKTGAVIGPVDIEI